MAFTYNNNVRRWFRDDGTQVRLGNRIKNSNGDYVQLNSDGTVTKLYDKQSGKFTRGSNNKLLVNRTDVNNMKAQHVYQNNKWRRDTVSNNHLKGNDTVYKSTDGKWHYYNSDKEVKFKSVPTKEVQSKPTKEIGFWEDITNDVRKSAANKTQRLKDISEGKNVITNLIGLQYETPGMAARFINKGLAVIMSPVAKRLSDSWKEPLSVLGSVMDVGKDLDWARSLVTPEEESITPWDERNKGIATEKWDFLNNVGLDRRSRDNLQETTNAAVAILGTKGLGGAAKGTISGLRSVGNIAKNVAKDLGTTGIKQAGRNLYSAIKTTDNLKYVPYVSNAKMATNTWRKLTNIVNPSRTIKDVGVRRYLGNYPAAVFHGIFSLDPMANVYNYSPTTAYLISKNF